MKKYSKIKSLEAIWEMKLKLCRNVHSMSLYKTVGLFLFLLLHKYFGCYGSLSFHRLIMGK